MHKPIIALAAFALVTPAAAQDEAGAQPPINCMEEMGGLDLAADMADDFLQENGIGDGPANPPEPRGRETALGCAALHNVEGDKLQPYLMANLAFLVSSELERRMLAAGMDMTPINQLVAELVADPELPVAEYIDSRPEEFVIPGARVAAEQGITLEHVMAWTGGFVGMRQMQINSEAELAGD